VATILLKLVVVLLLSQLAFGFLGFLPLWADIAVTGLLAVAALATPWRFFWHSEVDTARRLRDTSRSRLVFACAIALGGPVFCIAADLWFASRYPRYADGSWLAGPLWDVLIAAPFVLVAVLILATALSRPAAAIAALGLGAISALAYWSFATTDSSTAALAFLIPWFYGFPGVVLIFLVDGAVRSLTRRRTAGQAREM